MSRKNPSVRLKFRRLRVRSRVSGTADRPRLSVRRSQKHVYAQLVDDAGGRTLALVSSRHSELRQESSSGATVAAAARVGRALAEKAKALNITRAVFDRGGRPYHGRVKAVAEAARDAGLHI